MPRIECPYYTNLHKYGTDASSGQIFYFRVNYYPYYIADLVNEGGDSYHKVEKFFKQWKDMKYNGMPILTHSSDPPSNITAFMLIAFDAYKNSKFVFTPEVKSKINFLISVIKKWKTNKKYLLPYDEVKDKMMRKIR